MQKERIPKELKGALIWLSMSIILGFAVISFSEKINGPNAFFNNWWPVLVGLSIMVLGITNVHAWRESKRIRKGAHIKVQFLRAIVISLISLGLTMYAPAPIIKWQFFISICSFQIGIFMLAFDYLFNYYKGNEWSYFGTESVLDVFNAKIPIWLNIFLEVSFLIGTIWAFDKYIV